MWSVSVALFPLVLTFNQQCLPFSYNNKKLLKFFSKGDKQSLWIVLFFYYSTVGQIFFTWDKWETANSPIQPCKYLWIHKDTQRLTAFDSIKAGCMKDVRHTYFLYWIYLTGTSKNHKWGLGCFHENNLMSCS